MSLGAVLLLALLGASAPEEGALPFEHTYAVLVEKNEVLFTRVPLIFLELAGAALFDYDADGDDDLYLTNGPGFPNALLRNDGGAFPEEVSAEAGVGYPGGTAVVAGDLDNDGDTDLFVARRNRNALFFNRGDGTFVNLTGRAGVGAQEQLSISAALCDFDQDGFLDLYLGNRRLHPGDDAHPNLLFRNRGDGTFEEMGRRAGVDNPVTRALVGPGEAQNSTWAVTCLDYDNDGDQDLALAVDFSTVTLFQNRWVEEGDLRFDNVTLEAGLGATGNWMGLAPGDYDGDGWIDLFATNWGNSPNVYRVDIPVDTLRHALYLNNGDGTFTEGAAEAGVADWPFGWGAAALDWENDGDLDLFYAGNMIDHPRRPVQDNPAHLFLNDGTGRFEESRPAVELTNDLSDGTYQLGHAVATGDLDGDGRPDLVVANAAFPIPDNEVVRGIPRVFLNSEHATGDGGNWLKFELEGTASNRSGVGARVSVTAGGRTQARELRAGGGHLSQSSVTLLFGLGESERAERVTVRWPSGRVDVLEDVPGNQLLRLREPE